MKYFLLYFFYSGGAVCGSGSATNIMDFVGPVSGSDTGCIFRGPGTAICVCVCGSVPGSGSGSESALQSDNTFNNTFRFRERNITGGPASEPYISLCGAVRSPATYLLRHSIIKTMLIYGCELTVLSGAGRGAVSSSATNLIFSTKFKRVLYCECTHIFLLGCRCGCGVGAGAGLVCKTSVSGSGTVTVSVPISIKNSDFFFSFTSNTGTGTSVSTGTCTVCVFIKSFFYSVCFILDRSTLNVDIFTGTGTTTDTEIYTVLVFFKHLVLIVSITGMHGTLTLTVPVFF
jgi:hypothetical protein